MGCGKPDGSLRLLWDGTVKSLRCGSLYTEYAYDRDRNLTGLKTMLGNETIADNHYRYDGNGNRLEKCQRQNGGTALVTSYAYDSRNRLSVVEYPDRKEELFYDRAGNRTRRLTTGRDGNPQREELYRYDKRNRLTTCSDNGRITGFSYDGAGNLLSDDKATYEYDAFGRNTRAEIFDGHIQISRYDPEGLRHEMEENGRLVTFIFRGEEIITEETAEGMIRYIRTHELLASDAESARNYYHYASDEMGSITHVTAGEEILNRYEYDAWGVPEVCKEQTENRFLYNGQQYDAVTGQYYLRARFYNPVIGRFTQEDTYRGDGLNLYTYCQNNPVYYVDPSGHICENRANEIMNKLGRGDVLSHSENKKLAAYLRNKERRSGLTDAESSVLSQVDRKRKDGGKSGRKTNFDNEIPRSGSEWNEYLKGKYGADNVHWNINSVDDVFSDPTRLKGYTADELQKVLGNDWTRGVYGSNGGGWKLMNGDISIFYHPGGGKHGGSYYGISSGATGKIKVVNPETYIPLKGDKATIIYD